MAALEGSGKAEASRWVTGWNEVHGGAGLRWGEPALPRPASAATTAEGADGQPTAEAASPRRVRGARRSAPQTVQAAEWPCGRGGRPQARSAGARGTCPAAGLSLTNETTTLRKGTGFLPRGSHRDAGARGHKALPTPGSALSLRGPSGAEAPEHLTPNSAVTGHLPASFGAHCLGVGCLGSAPLSTAMHK